MSGELLLLLLGAMLLLAAALAARLRTTGGGRAGSTLRGAVASTGLLCVVAALILMGGGDAVAPMGPVSVTIADELGPDQVSERVRVLLDGHDVGVVEVDGQTPSARLTVTVSRAGRHAYTLHTKRQVKGQQPTEVRNGGHVVIEGKSSHLDVLSNADGETFLVPRE